MQLPRPPTPFRLFPPLFDADDLFSKLKLAGSVREQSYRTNDMREKGPLLVYSHDGREGGLRPPVHTLWGEFYETFPRDPHDVSQPSWRAVFVVFVLFFLCAQQVEQ